MGHAGNILLVAFVITQINTYSIQNIRFTFPCGLDICTFPGQYCDQSDKDSLRCSDCDLDTLCQSDEIPEQCKPLCKDAKERNEQCPQPTTHPLDWGKGSITVYFISMIAFLITTIVLVVIMGVTRHHQRTQKGPSRIQHPTDSQNSPQTHALQQRG